MVGQVILHMRTTMKYKQTKKTNYFVTRNSSIMQIDQLSVNNVHAINVGIRSSLNRKTRDLHKMHI